MEVVDAHGVSGATIPRIAEAAKVAPASVYRRFRDKESLLRAAFIDALKHANATNAAAVPPLMKNRSLEWIAGAIALSLISQFRQRPTLLRSILRFVESDDDEEFRGEAISLIVGNVEAVIERIVSAFGKQIPHTDPQRAVTFAILVMANVIQTRALERFSFWKAMLPLSDDDMVVELKHMFLAYLLTQR